MKGGGAFIWEQKIKLTWFKRERGSYNQDFMLIVADKLSELDFRSEFLNKTTH